MRFLDYNYVRQTNVDLIASSAHSNFPVSNLKHDFRSKVWRTTGTFIINTTNNKIDFRETNAGPQITATISSGTYTPDTLEVEIAAKMTAATLNARTYTVLYSESTGKWTITGSTFLELLWLSGSNTATSIGPSIGYAVLDETGGTAYTSASVAIHTEESVVIDLKSTESIDSFLMLWSPIDGTGVSTDADIFLQANHTNNWSSPAVNIQVTIDSIFLTCSHFFSSSQNYRYWRVKIIDPKNSNLYIQIGNIILTKATVLSDSPEKGFTYTLEDGSKRIVTEFGNQYVDRLPFRQKISFNYAALQYSDVLILEEMYRRNASNIPITVVLDETASCFDKDHFMVYGYFESTLVHKQIAHILFQEDLTITETF